MQLWAYARIGWGATLDEFWEYTPAQYAALVELYNDAQILQDMRFGVLVSTVARMFGGKNAEKLTPAHFFPSIAAVTGQNLETPQNALYDHLQAALGGEDHHGQR